MLRLCFHNRLPSSALPSSPAHTHPYQVSVSLASPDDGCKDRDQASSAGMHFVAATRQIGDMTA